MFRRWFTKNSSFFCVDRPFRFRFRIRQFLLLPRAQWGKEVKKTLIITCRCKRELQHFKLSIMFSTVWTQRLGCKVTTSSNVHDDDLPPELKLSFVQSAFFLINRSFCSFVCFSRSFSYSLAFFLVRSFVLFYFILFFFAALPNVSVTLKVAMTRCNFICLNIEFLARRIFTCLLCETLPAKRWHPNQGE